MPKIEVSLQLGWGVRFWRRERGLSLAELAQKLGAPLSRVEAIESGTAEIHLDDLQLLADALSVKPRDLFAECEPSSEKSVKNSVA